MGGGSKETKTVSNPYEGLPDWVLDYYKDDIAEGKEVMADAGPIRDWLAANPRAIMDMSPHERRAVQDIANRATEGHRQLRTARGELRQGKADSEDMFGDARDMLDFGWSQGEDMYGDASDMLAEGRAESGDLFADARAMMEGGQSRSGRLLSDAEKMMTSDQFESGYTDDVVNTTLDGMRRQAARDAMMRGGSEAAVGGMGGTRGAVSSALAAQLNGMNMAEMEAKLRDEGHRFGVDAGFQGADFLRGLSASEMDNAMRGVDVLTGRSRDVVDYAGRGADMAMGRGRDAMDYSRSGADMLDGRSRSIMADAFGTSDRLGDMARTHMDFDLQSAGARGTYGAMQRELEQQKADAYRTSGQDATSWYTDIFNATRQLPATGGGVTSRTEPGPGLFSQLLGGAATAAGIWSKLSDERAKEDIDIESGALDKLRDVPAYSYRYREGYGGGPDRTSGLMAQDLERSGITGAVRERADGMKEVDAYPILATVVQAVRELDDRTRANQGLEI